MKPILDIIEDKLVGKNILELACGTGNWTITLSSRARQVIAVDSSPQSLEIGRKKLVDFDNVTLMNQDVFSLSLPESSFDTIFTADFYSHIPLLLLPDFWSTAAKQLAPGGQVIIVDMTDREHSRRKFSRYDENGNRLEKRPLPDGTVTEVVKNFPGEQEIRRTAGRNFGQIRYWRFDDLERWLLICSR